MKKKKKIIPIIIVILLIALGSLSFFVYSNHKEEVRKTLEEQKRKSTIKKIKSHYSNVVETTKEAELLNNEFKVVGTVGVNEILNLKEEENIDENTKYFFINNLEYYIKYEDVTPYKDEVVKEDDKYKKYLLFDENVVIKEKGKLLNRNKDKLVYSMNEKIDLPIIRKDDDGVFVEYLERLVFVKNEDIENRYEKHNNDQVEATSIPVTCYHFIYYPEDTGCDEIICHSKAQIESHFTYLNENNYLTLNTTELGLYLEDKIRLPKNSILVTIDDGARAEKFIPVLEEYNINATLFLITSWYQPDAFQSPRMEIASHGHDLHVGNICSGGQGGRMRCLEKDKLIEDLTTSKNILNTEAFCYPFYEYNDHAINALKEAGFKMAFAGGQQKVRKGVDFYKIPRITIMGDTTLNEYISLIN